MHYRRCGDGPFVDAWRPNCLSVGLPKGRSLQSVGMSYPFALFTKAVVNTDSLLVHFEFRTSSPLLVMLILERSTSALLHMLHVLLSVSCKSVEHFHCQDSILMPCCI